MAANPVQTAPITATLNGDNTVVAAVPGKRIRVLGYVLIGSAAVVATWKTGSGAGGSNVALTGPLHLTTVPLVLTPGQQIPQSWGWHETAVGELLNLFLSAAVEVDGFVMYQAFD